MFRRILPLLALLGLVIAGPHAAAMAMPAMEHMAAASVEAASAEAAPCHSKKMAEKPAKAPEKCCPDGCKGQCAPVLALVGNAPAFRSEAVKAVPFIELRAPAPESAPQRQDRPPRSFG